MTWTLAFAEADPDDVDLLGGKGSGLARMTRAGLRVPPGFVITTAACREFLGTGTVPESLAGEVLGRVAELEAATGKTFGDGPLPLLLSVRSGAPVSMPGMMDTILDLGLNRRAAVALGELTGDVGFVADVVHRFHTMYGEIVFDALPDEAPGRPPVGAGEDAAAVHDRIRAECQDALTLDTGDAVPGEPRDQLLGAIEAVFRSWDNRRARTYREFHGIPEDLGTAVVVQAMVFGNLGADSGSGVVFTRDPVTGEPGLFGEYLRDSQGEDVVAGLRTPDRIVDALAPGLLAELRGTCADLERRQADVLDIEFTVERGVLWFLQVRSAKRTPQAALRIAADLVSEGLLPRDRVFAAVGPEQIRQVQRPGFDAGEVEAARAGGRLLTTGIGACPGQVSGMLVLDPDRARSIAEDGTPVVLVRQITSPADLHGMIAAEGILTATGGATSHAAVVARALATPCVVGAGELSVDPGARVVKVAGRALTEGEQVSIDGGTGEVFTGGFTSSAPAATSGALAAVTRIAGELAGCEVLGRIARPADVPGALDAGATGLVTAVDDVLAATGHLDGLVAALLGHDRRAAGAADLSGIADLVAEEFAPLLAAAGDAEVGVRAIDFIADESRELLQQTALTTRHPELSVPLGLPGLVGAQLAGLGRAVAATGGRARVHLAVRHVSDPAEAAALRTLRREAGVPVEVGAYLTSPRGAFCASRIAAEGEVLWLELRALQSAVFGIAARHLLTADPLDGYLRRGLLGTDPRTSLDPSVAGLVARVAEAARETPGCRVGVRLSGEVSAAVVSALYDLGLRRFAADALETRPLLVALGRAATG